MVEVNNPKQEPGLAPGPIDEFFKWLFPTGGYSFWWNIKCMLTCAFFSYFALNLIVGITRMWQLHTFGLISFGPFNDYKGGYTLTDETLIQTAIAGLMGGIGSIIFCMKELFDFWKKKDLTAKFVPSMPRPFFGILLAIIFYFILKAGMIATAGTASPTSSTPEAINAARTSAAGIGGLVGIFADEAMFRLKAVAKALFMPEETGSSSVSS